MNTTNRPLHSGYIDPVIKWSGSKRSVASVLGTLFPPAKRHIEPFIGSGATLPFRTAKAALAGDVIPELIDLWRLIRDNPNTVTKEYESRWLRLQKEGHTAYYAIRESFNTNRCPFDLLFLTRTCVNGLVRFNSYGEFNNSLHHTRPGIAPARFSRIIHQWSQVVQGVEFIVADYLETLSVVDTDDFVFLDPPYGGTKGRYIPKEFSLQLFWNELDRLNSLDVKWILTFDGKAGKRTYTVDIPKTLFKVHLDLPTGNSPFTKLMKTGVDAVVESVYLNFDPSPKTLSQIDDLFQERLYGRTEAKVKQYTFFA